MKLLRYLWCLALALMLAAPAQAQLKPVPPLTGRVVDEAGMLDASQRQRLTSVLADYEAQTGSQIAVLLVKSTEPEAIEQYSIRVTDAWKLGRKGVDDGVLLVVARDNPKALRRLRIEAGRGVQGSLTDAQSKRILQDVIAPHFRENNYYEGLVAGVSAIATLIKQEKLPPAQRQQAQQHQQSSPLASLLNLLAPLLFFAAFAGIVFFRRRGRYLSTGAPTMQRSGWNNATTGFILGNILSDEMHRRGGGGFSGGFDGGGFSSGGGGFSGGGGSFDGGGASGDW